ncbi:MAG TPA: hypothetical protein GXX36_14055 [Clostridiaceae bacterium]|nr:hypothetical protein [Clostridiaceae bacterium]
MKTKLLRRTLSILLSAILVLTTIISTALQVSAAGDGAASDFASRLEAKYIDPDRVYQSDIRWWLAEASNTDEALLEEIQALYDAGFRGVELCMQSDNNAPDAVYAYGSEMWAHKWKLIMNKLLDLGMGVYLTSGTHWATSNIPGLNPDSQEAMQVLAMGTQKVAAGESITALPKPPTRRASNVGKFLGAFAYKLVNEEERRIISQRPVTYTSYSVDEDSVIDLSKVATITQGDTIYDQLVDWTAPDDGEYIIFSFWTHGNYKTASPAAETCYCTNYFDVRGVEALKKFWTEHYLDDPVLNEKIKNGDVQLFMDSLEIDTGGGITWWSEDMREEFIARKGYDIMPYLFLVEGLPQVQAVYNPYYEPAMGYHDLEGNKNLREKIINDWVDVLTQLYIERMLIPLKEWLNSIGIKTRAQISYGRSIEITEPSVYVDYPEAENFNQYNQVDILRLHTAGSKLQNKVLSTETGAELPTYGTSAQTRLHDAYAQYAAGFQRVIWHIWSAGYSYGENSSWPGWGSNFDRWGTREPNARDFDEFNAHIGRVQQLLQTGRSRTDIGFIHNNWNQGLRFGGSAQYGGGAVPSYFNGMNWQLAHMGVYYRSTELQDNGYTYDYLSPDLLFADGVYFDETTKTVEKAGYKALVLYQDWLDVKGAERILDWAKKGLKVVIIDGAAKRTPFNDGKDAELARIIDELKTLPTVRTAAIYDASEDFNYFAPVAEGYKDGVYEALQELGVRPYAEYAEPNHQLLTQSRQDEDGNMYLYVYNYCSNDYHQNSYIESVRNEDHGTNIKTEIKMDGIFIPYSIDAWSGKVTELAQYRYENGQTVIPVDLDYDNIALYAFEAVDKEKVRINSTVAESAYRNGNKMVLRFTDSGTYKTTLSDGRTYQTTVQVPEAYDITDWNLTVESWTAGTNKLRSEETIGNVTTVNTKVETIKTNIDVTLPKLTTWDNIPEVGKNVSGLGRYEATFNWDSSKADGAYLNFGDTLVSSMKVWINGQKVGGDVSQNPTKVKASVGEGFEGKDLYSGGVNWVKPIVDISPYLVDGENEIVIEYSSTLTNVQLARGAIREQMHNRGWWNNNCKYFSYGPSQAVIVPFVEKVLQDEPGEEFTVNTTFTVGEKANATKLEANAMLDASATITNNSAGSKQVLLIVALYDSSNRMVNVSYLAKEVAEGATENFHAGFKLPSNVTGYKAKAFVWEGESLLSTNMEPVSNVAEITD